MAISCVCMQTSKFSARWEGRVTLKVSVERLSAREVGGVAEGEVTFYFPYFLSH